MNSRETRSAFALVFWLLITGCSRSLVSGGIIDVNNLWANLVLNLASAFAGLYLGYDMVVSPKTSVFYRFRRGGYPSGIIQIGGAIFLVAMLVVGYLSVRYVLTHNP